MAATVAGAWLIGLDGARPRHARGLAGTRAAGLKASFGSDAKPLHAGWASLVALTSLQWAGRGMTGAGDILDGPQGIGGRHLVSGARARCSKRCSTLTAVPPTF